MGDGWVYNTIADYLSVFLVCCASKGKTSTGVLDAYQQWLATGHKLAEEAAPEGGGGEPSYHSTFDAVRGEGQPKALDSCLNHLFTHVDFNTGTAGVASMKGICQKQGFYVGSRPGTYSAKDSGKGSLVLNAGFTTSISKGKIAADWSIIATAAHEVSHNFGSRHDCCTACTKDELVNGETQICPGHSVWIDGTEYTFKSDGVNNECVPDDASDVSGGFLMYPSSGMTVKALLTEANLATKTTFSACSVSDVVGTVEEQGSCLTIPDPCANGAAGAAGCCDPDSGTLLAKGTVCKASDATLPCTTSASCDGT